jgi:hypothetical protein
MRPGVPTTMCAPCSSEAICGRIGEPPVSTRILTLPTLRARRRSSFATWSASSRVGHSTSACVANHAGLSFCSRPMPKAAVLPLPVFACAIRSRPSSTGGRLCAWIGVIS